MTYSNGSFNPNPLANPFNTRLGPSNYSLNPAGQSYIGDKGFNSKSKDLPDPVMLGQQSQNDLHTPVSDQPMRLSELQGLIDSYAAGKTWNDREINRLDATDNQIDQKSAAYWKEVDKKTQVALSSMSDEQKEMLADLENMFPASKFVDDER